MSWTCLFCAKAQILGEANTDNQWRGLRVGETVHGYVALRVSGIRCANPECNEVAVVVQLEKAKYTRVNGEFHMVDEEPIQIYRLRPSSTSRVLPAYIPAALIEDYVEACQIRDLSPKASATLARRCLQGMIRDFAGVSKARLIDEITTLRNAVNAGSAPQGITSDSIDAVDAVRSIGNIGAHMEKDIDLIVEVDPGEAQALIELLEILFDEWYIARHDRQKRLARVQAIAAQKKADLAAQKAGATSAGGAAPTTP